VRDRVGSRLSIMHGGIFRGSRIVAGSFTPADRSSCKGYIRYAHIFTAVDARQETALPRERTDYVREEGQMILSEYSTGREILDVLEI